MFHSTLCCKRGAATWLVCSENLYQRAQEPHCCLGDEATSWHRKRSREGISLDQNMKNKILQIPLNILKKIMEEYQDRQRSWLGNWKL